MCGEGNEYAEYCTHQNVRPMVLVILDSEIQDNNFWVLEVREMMFVILDSEIQDNNFWVIEDEGSFWLFITK